ncbi:MAG TPA: TraR/DksA C4-type zinc finger protein [Gemmatimonadota bacterium]|nr:TraR/DksA C4-type zinc finger protein [Gemmatimonadota bacterium]
MAKKKDRKPGRKRPVAGKSARKIATRRSAKKPAAKKSPAKKPAAKKPAAKKPAAKKPAAKKPAAKKPAAKKPAARKPAARKPTAKSKAHRTTSRQRSSKRPAAGKARRGQRDAEFFEHFRGRLLDDRQQITRRLDELREELRGLEEAPARELEEWAQEEKDRDILIRLEERETEELRRIQAALGLIDSREYGKCQVCGKPIPRARLEELPTAFRCVEHTP